MRAVDEAGGTPEVLSTFALHPEERVPAGLRVETELDPEGASLSVGVAGLILTGGGDVDPALYGQERHHRTHNVSRRRDVFEMGLLEQALDRELPVLAICRGMQLANVFLGGTLEQHIPEVAGRLPHDRARPGADAVHNIRLKEGSLLACCLEATEVGANSHHHQALDEVARSFREIGWAGDGVLEAVESTEHAWVLGVQWHPEVMAPVNTDQARIFECFVAAAREQATSLSTARTA